MFGFVNLALFLAFQLSFSSCSASKPVQLCGSYTTTRDADAADVLAFSFREPVQPVKLPAQFTVIDVYFHVITAGEGPENGGITDVRIALQMKVLNEAFWGTGYQFEHKRTSRVVNNDWFYGVRRKNPQERLMKNSLRVGSLDPKTLNIYTVGFDGQAGPSGYASYPWDIRTSLGLVDDGIVMQHTAIAGGTNGFNRSSGLALVHQVAHWAGLLHTFFGGCTGRGDRVKDTPPEDYVASVDGCKPRKTCPGSHTSDLIDNFMGSSPEQCQKSFTAGQIGRMKMFLTFFRRIP